ncbi:MAG: T9SS type A sorting domain-containing protein, partial [Bacteroidota bacterium]
GSPRWLYTDSNGMMTNLTSANYTGPFLIRANDQNFVHAARTGTSSPPEQDVFVRKFDLDGNILWTHFPPGNLFGNEAVSDLLQTADGDYVITGAPAYMTRLNENGDVAWKTVLPDPEEDNIYQYLAVQLEDGSFFMAASSAWFTTNNPLMTHAAHIDAAGNRLWFGSLEADVQIEQMVVAADGNIVVAGRNPDYNFVLVKLDNNGNTIWEIEIPNAIYPLAYTGDLLVTMDGGFALLANSQGTEEDLYLIKMDSEGSIEWSQTYGGPFRDNGQDLLQLPDGGYVIGGGANGTGEDQSTYLIRTDELGNAASGLIQGQVQYDTDENCILSPDEQALENWIVSAENSTGLFYASVAADGSYAIEVTPGEYTVTLNVPNEYWMVCTNEVQVSAMDTVAVDFAVQSIEQCPLMEVQIQNYGLRLCEPATMNVLCRNLGTSLAEDVSVDIEFDDDLEIISASVPFSPVGINTYNFTLGDIDFLQQSTFTVEVVTGCDIVLLGQSLCVEAYVYPDSSCLAPNDLWSGASIAASASCEGDEVHLVLENIGEAAMQQELRYTVIEDHVIMLEDVPFGPLEPGQSVLLPRVADGTFYRIESEQAAFHPGTSMPSAFIEACGENAAGEISLGFVNQHPLDDADYFLDINCTEVVAAYDPNAKRALPQGYETAHYIEPNTRITYQLHFQNTGTAPANEVILLDQLSPHLDPTTVEVGVSSHFYEFDMLRDGTLRFTFPDIQLPDSTANEPESHGYVQFSVAQQDDVELGTVIENTAAIYFDFNPAIWTNTTFHTIGRDFIFVEADEIAESPLQVQVFPNPFQEEVTILVERTDLESLNFLLFDSSGRKILSRSFSGNRVQIDGTAWPAGIYFYQINSAQGLIGSGKMIAK